MADNNIGASRLLGTNGLQQAVDSLTNKVNKIANSFGNLSTSINNLTGSANRAGGFSSTTYNWNSNSNRIGYSNNGGAGGGRFTTGTQGGGSRNNGGSGKFSIGLSMGAAAMYAATNYGNKNMAGFMQADMFGMYSAQLGGVGPGGAFGASVAARQNIIANNYLALSYQDATQAAYLNTYTFGQAAQLGGRPNDAFKRNMNQVQGFGYASPTLGALGSARAANETYSARSLMMSQALGIGPTIGPGGVRVSMGEIAQRIMARSLAPGRSYTPGNIAAALGQGGGLGTNLNYYARQMGWSDQTNMEYRNYITGLVSAQASGVSSGEFADMMSKAQNGDVSSRNRLAKFGVGASMFETQRNLNSTAMTRGNDILTGMAPAFDQATNAINQFSTAVNSFLQTTGLGQGFGTAAGYGSAISNSVGGFASGFGGMGGMFMAARLFGRGGFGRAARVGGMVNATRGANGAYNITSAGGSSSVLSGLLGAATGIAGYGASQKLSNEVGAYGERKYGNDLSGLYKKDANGNPIIDPNPQSTVRKFMRFDGRAGGGTNASSAGGGYSPGTAASGATAAQVLKFAESQLGVPYVYGGTTPGKGLDCSALVQWAFGQAGVKLPRVSQDQAHSGVAIGLGQVQAGDLLFKGDPATHVAIALGNGKLIEAPRTGLNVRIRGYSPSEFTSARRVLGSVGNMSSLLNDNTGKAIKNTLSNSQSRSGGNTGDLGTTSEAAAVSSALSAIISGVQPGSRSAAGTAGTSPLGQVPTGNGGNDKASLQAYAKQLLAKYGWANQWNDFDALVMSESGWDVHARNKQSGAYGIPQSLPGKKMSSAGADWETSGDTQLRWMMDYIQGRYGSPSNAWSFHKKNNWYAAGAWEIDKDQNAVVHRGEMIIPAKQAESIRQVLLNNSYNPGMQKHGGSGGGGITIGSITVQLPAGYAGTQQEAQMAGRAIADAIYENTRLKNLQRGQ